jgi:hypothetical protein
VTVAIGTLGRQGIVLAADREITHPNAKTRHRKIWSGGYGSVSIVATGCGTWGYLQSACQKIIKIVPACSDIDEAQELIEAVVRKIYKEEIEIDPARYGSEPPTFDLLVGVWTKSGDGLIRTEAATVRRTTEPEFLGSGGPLAQVLCQSYLGTVLSNKQVGILMANAIRVVKQTTAGCGGPTDVASLDRSGNINWQDTEHLETVLDKFGRWTRPFLLACADPSIDDKIFEGIVETLHREAKKLREQERERERVP